MQEIILAKLGIQERSAFNILNDKELCERIINETPIWINDFIKEYDIPKHTIQKLIKKNIISSFSNSENKGSKIFIFKEETLKIFKLNYSNTSQLFDNINRVVELYLLRIKNTITERQYEIIYDGLINNMSYDDMAKKYDLTRERARMIYDIANRRVKHSERINVDYEKLKSEYEILKYEVEALKQKRIVLSKSKVLIEPKVVNPIFSQKLVDMDLSVRALNCLKAADIETLGELVSFSNKNELLKFRNFGKKSLTELEDLVSVKGLQFGMKVFIQS